MWVKAGQGAALRPNTPSRVGERRTQLLDVRHSGRESFGLPAARGRAERAVVILMHETPECTSLVPAASSLFTRVGVARCALPPTKPA